MPKLDVRPNKEVFLEAAAGRTLAVLNQTDVWDLAHGTIKKLLGGEFVSEKTIREMAEKLKRPVSQLVLPREDTFVSSDPKYFESLKYGWYIDNDRYNYKDKSAGQPTWLKESVELQAVASLQPSVIHVTGKVINEFNEAFTVTGARLGDHHFSLHGRSEPGGWGLDGMFSLQVDNVLCGIWSGINHLGLNIGVYRMFLSPHQLTQNDIKNLTERVRIDPVVKSNTFGWGE